MFNFKVAPEDYQRMRQCFFDFCWVNQLTIKEAKDVLGRLQEDLQNQVCSAQCGR